MTTLARKLRATDYFTLGWGTMVGVGWLVIMDDWLLRGGALGTALGFLIGGALLLPVGWVYGKLIIAMPDAAGEIAYTSAVCSFGSRQRLKAAAVIRNCHPTFQRPRSLVLRIPPVCFIHPKAFSISGRFFWLIW